MALVVVIEDYYIPELASAVMANITEASSETLAMCFEWAARAAQANVSKRMN